MHHPTPILQRSTAPDALYGAILALEATVAALLKEHAEHQPQPQLWLEALRDRVQATLADAQLTSEYGTGREDVLSAADQAIASLFSASASTATRSSPAASGDSAGSGA